MEVGKITLWQQLNMMLALDKTRKGLCNVFDLPKEWLYFGAQWGFSVGPTSWAVQFGAPPGAHNVGCKWDHGDMFAKIWACQIFWTDDGTRWKAGPPNSPGLILKTMNICRRFDNNQMLILERGSDWWLWKLSYEGASSSDSFYSTACASSRLLYLTKKTLQTGTMLSSQSTVDTHQAIGTWTFDLQQSRKREPAVKHHWQLTLCFLTS